jgi:hypothetical protein
MKEKHLLFHVIFCLFVSFLNSNVAMAENQQIKVMDIETNEMIKETKLSSKMDKYAISAIKSIQKVTVQANPIPNKGYLIRIPLTKSYKVKNKWFDSLISEIILIYDKSSENQGRLILYDDENTPMFFDIEFNFTDLLKTLDIKE